MYKAYAVSVLYGADQNISAISSISSIAIATISVHCYLAVDG